MAKSDRANAETAQAVEEVFGVQGTIGLSIVRGIYSTLARTMNSCRINHDEQILG